jgi:hypothetical protein
MRGAATFNQPPAVARWVQAYLISARYSSRIEGVVFSAHPLTQPSWTVWLPLELLIHALVSGKPLGRAQMRVYRAAVVGAMPPQLRVSRSGGFAAGRL